jgi:hypothetical protein
VNRIVIGKLRYRLLVAPNTKVSGIHLQQLSVVGPMRQMTGAAIREHRLVDMFRGVDLRGNRLMATQTELVVGHGYQVIEFGSMGKMTNQALSLCNRLVQKRVGGTRVHGVRLTSRAISRMTLAAEIWDACGQKKEAACSAVRIMALQALELSVCLMNVRRRRIVTMTEHA